MRASVPASLRLAARRWVPLPLGLVLPHGGRRCAARTSARPAGRERLDPEAQREAACRGPGRSPVTTPVTPRRVRCRAGVRRGGHALSTATGGGAGYGGGGGSVRLL